MLLAFVIFVASVPTEATTVVKSFTKLTSGSHGFPQLADNTFVCGVSVGDDINGDGIRDMIFSAPFSGAGVIYVASMAANGTTILNTTTISVDTPGFDSTLTPGDIFGFTVFLRLDLNKDGVPDVAAGAPNHDSSQALLTFRFFPKMEPCKAIESFPQEIVGSVSVGVMFGYSVSFGADINTDGFLDLVSSAVSDKDGFFEAGAI